jgi:plasmid maintenance system antidote protein VapI
MLLEEFLKPLKLTPTEAARRLRLPLHRVHRRIKGMRGITPDTAPRFIDRLGTGLH